MESDVQFHPFGPVVVNGEVVRMVVISPGCSVRSITHRHFIDNDGHEECPLEAESLYTKLRRQTKAPADGRDTPWRRAWANIVVGPLAALRARWHRWTRPALPEPTPQERGEVGVFRSGGEARETLSPPEPENDPEAALARALKGEWQLRQIASHMSYAIKRRIDYNRLMRSMVPIQVMPEGVPLIYDRNFSTEPPRPDPMPTPGPGQRVHR